MLDLVRRNIDPAKYQPSENAGIIRNLMSKNCSPLPSIGNQPSVTPKTNIKQRQTKNTGNDRPSRATNLPILSQRESHFTAERIPSGTPIIKDIKKEVAPSSKEFGNLWKYMSDTGIVNWKEVPKSPLNTLLTNFQY